ncbi:cellulose synthase-like protein [Musa troglodytarum]|uniref:Cellulose synthase-like protein n=1 Tax=Musa troglodytarum TaxID=320322 RepID=A0A9E7HKK7_9LILI|nr:cellulose synthase-like protein [Musa troglodytarum]
MFAIQISNFFLINLTYTYIHLGVASSGGEKKMTAKTFHALRVSSFVAFNRAHAFLYSLAILALLRHHLACLLSSPSLLPSALFLADVVLAVMWVASQVFRWRPVSRQEFPDPLLREVGSDGLPALDVFICTADPHKEPPISVVGTALSAMSFDYPTDRLSIYVSDDGGSAVTLFAFMEAARFARYWLPFCKKNGLLERSPEAYFRSNKGGDSEKMRMMYLTMKEKVETALERGYVSKDLPSSGEDDELFERWKGFTRHDHPSVIQVLLEGSKDSDITGNALPNLIYVSREKRPTSHHHFKAGALNALLRVSNTMSNAPVILTLDCDTYCSDPRSPLHALCYLLDPALSSNLAFVQFPQRFYGINKNDIYGGEIKRLYTITARGKDGILGPSYFGSGCFISRRCLQGIPSSPSLAQEARVPSSSESVLRKAHEVAGCTYELRTKWGSVMGFRYGSLVEDYYTSFRLHCEGWRSVFCNPVRPAFLGDVPKSLNDVLGQCKRWCVGLLEVGFSRYSPLTFGTTNASLLAGLGYAYDAFWGIWCIPVTTYGLLPQLALICQTPLLPKVSDPWFYLYVYLFTAAYGQDLVEFLADDGTIGRWWSDQRMWMIKGVTAYLFGSIQFALKKIGISAAEFNVTSKVMEDEQRERYGRGAFDLGVQSSFFVALGTVAVVNLSSLVVGIARAATTKGFLHEQFAQLFLSGFVAANCWPIYEAMFLRSDGGRMPRTTTVISLIVAGLLLVLGFLEVGSGGVPLAYSIKNKAVESSTYMDSVYLLTYFTKPESMAGGR